MAFPPILTNRENVGVASDCEFMRMFFWDSGQHPAQILENNHKVQIPCTVSIVNLYLVIARNENVFVGQRSAPSSNSKKHFSLILSIVLCCQVVSSGCEE